MVFIALTASATAWPLSRASAADLRAISSVCVALSAVCLMFAVICSTELDASSVDEACSVAPWLSCSAVEAISAEPEATCPAPPVTSPTTRRRLAVISFIDPSRSAISSLLRMSAVSVRSPAATLRDRSMARVSPREMVITIQVPVPALAKAMTAMIVIVRLRALL